jgi:endoglucanase
LAQTPTATILAGSPGDAATAERVVTAATAKRQLPVLALYNIPRRDCSGHNSAGGAQGGRKYLSWLGRVVDAFEGHPVVVVLEPDAVAEITAGCMPPHTADLLRAAVQRIERDPETRVYLDAGNPGWFRRPGQIRRLVSNLRSAGIGRVNGFSLNVSNYFSLNTGNPGVQSVLEYGRMLSKALGGAHFVVDTSRNGNGPYGDGTEPQAWCNPPGRKIGALPTTHTGQPLVDAYLWVKAPGDSDGTCRGGPPAGVFWPARALALVRG